MRFLHLLSAVTFCAASPLLLNGCSTDGSVTTAAATLPQVATNWSITAGTAASAPLLPGLSGSLTGTGSQVNGTLHPSTGTACAATGTAIPVSGGVDGTGKLTLHGTLAGGTLSVSGMVSADGRSLSSASYGVTGGGCAMAQTAAGPAQAYAPVTGTYMGQIADASGQSAQYTVNITQSTTSDANGNFSATGYATFAGNPCIASPSTTTTAQITGGSFALTYTDASTQNQVAVSGSFAPDASQLNVTGYTLTGNCQDSGAGGVLKRQ